MDRRLSPVGQPQPEDGRIVTAMRFQFDREKSRDVKRKHGVSLEEAQEIFDQVYLVYQNERRSGTVSCDRLVPGPPLLCYVRDQTSLRG